MSDLYCRRCGEAYEAYHIANDVEPEERRRFLAGEGCSACGFGTRCTTCDGTKVERGPRLKVVPAECKLCDDRYVLIIRREDKDDGSGFPENKAKWALGYRPFYREITFPSEEQVIYRHIAEYIKPATDHTTYPTTYWPGVSKQSVAIRCFEPACVERQKLLNPCPVCQGSGQLAKLSSERDDKLAENFLWGVADSTDLDPLEALEPYFAAEERRTKEQPASEPAPIKNLQGNRRL